MTKLAKTIMVQGTASNVGKSIVTTALCRIISRRGYKVAPFKAQNMANNSYVTAQGGEIGRAQAVQAFACGVEPHQAMNPILLKPNTDQSSQIVVMGKPMATLTAMEYQKKKANLTSYIDESLTLLRETFDVVIIEGAGSPAEINMKQYDIVNMHVAKRVSSPVILVADIDKGGVFAQIIGTFELLEESEKSLVKTFLINKFRGDKAILNPGIEWIEKRIQRKSLGVLPMIKDLNIEEEDAVVLQETSRHKNGVQKYKLLIQVIHLPRISNFTDFESLSREEDVVLEYIDKPDRHRLPDLLIIPGTKSTMADLKFLKESGMQDYIKRCARSGVSILGICGGYQMMGQTIEDPHHSESAETFINGLGLIPSKTVFEKTKTTFQVKALEIESQLPIEGYEIHMGQTQTLNRVAPFLKIIERGGREVKDSDGVMIQPTNGSTGYICGTYIHGLFDASQFRRYFLNKIRKSVGLEMSNQHILSQENTSLKAFDRLADIVEQNIDMNFLGEILGERL